MKKLLRNPFFIAAILITFAGITALIIYLVKKQQKALPANPLQGSKQPNGQTSQHEQNASAPPLAETNPAAAQETIRLSKPYQRSAKIKKLQKSLNKKGYELTEDGIYGEFTYAAALEAYPNFLSDGQIDPDELLAILDAASDYNSSFAWTRPAISKTGESIASIVQSIGIDSSYDATTDAQTINESLSWWNDDEQAIKEVLYRLSKAQIATLLVTFQSHYNQSLDDYLKGGLLWGLDDVQYDDVLSIVRSRP